MRPFNVDACHSFARGVNKISFPGFVCSANIEGAMLRKYLFKIECVCDVFALCSAFHISIKLILTRVVRSKMNIRILNAGHLGNAIALSPPPKRVRLTDDTVKQLKDAKDLLELGVLTQAELQELKAKVLFAV